MVSCHAWNPVADTGTTKFCHSTLLPLLALILKEMLQLLFDLVFNNSCEYNGKQKKN